ncbi:MAG: hypothetical protein E6Q77_04025 [Rhizobium sp.]|nr:MAG: hypothetical protein E6Q77_04025 [Rhizobium sp.]
MTDTAQALPAETGRLADIATASDAFKAFVSEEPIKERDRDERGRFAPKEQEEIQVEEPEEGAEAEYDAETDEGEEAADEAQPDPVDMPASWNKEKAELWEALPPDAQAYIAEREGERDRAVNAKFQEAANARKATEAQLVEANANRDRFAQLSDVLLSAYQFNEPNPRDYGAGTGNYNREGYDLAVAAFRENVQFVQQIQQQREQIAAQQQREEQEAARAAFETVEEIGRPKLLEAVPDIADNAKAPAILNAIVEYAISQGIPESVFTENADSISSAELLLAWKASEYDKIKGAQAKVKETPAPKPATPSARPGVATSRSASRQATLRKAQDRLATSGSIDDAAAVFKLLG